MENNKKKSLLSKKSSAFLLTLNQPDKFHNLLQYLKSLKHFQYGIAGKEKAPSTGHEHIHIFIQYKRSIQLCLKKVEGAHVDKCYGTPQQNKKYVEKGKIIWEDGEMKIKGFLTIEQVEGMTSKKRLQLPIQYYNIIEKIETKEEGELITSKFKKNVKVYYISGRSGIGKTRFACYLLDKMPFNLVKYENGFWMGLGNKRAALYDDWRDSHMKPSEFLHFIDYNRQILNIKGGYRLNNYEVIVITSIFRLEEIYQDEEGESRIQWTRRIKEIHLSVV